MQAFILAGGFATRLWPLTEKRAKPLLPLAGKPIISYLVEQIPGDVPVTVSTNAALADGFEQWKQDEQHDNVTILIEDAQHDDHKLGALGAVAQWIEQEKIDDDVLLLTGDNYCGFAMDAFLGTYKEDTTLLAAYDIQDKEKAKGFGTVITEGTRVTAFEEKPAEPKTTLVSTGCSILPKKTLSILTNFAKEHPDNVGGIFEELLRHNEPIDCFTFTEPWFDIGSFHAYLEATQLLVGEDVHKESGAVCEECTCTGSVVIGKGSKVKNSKLENVVVFENCTIDDCVLENCIIDNQSQLSGIDLTGKMLREGTALKR